MAQSAAARGIDRLIEIMARLRSPDGGCPWDVEQTFATIAPYTIEEAYEVADAIERDALDELPDELGDLLLQVVFHAQMAREADLFEFADVANRIGDKMVRRHPHVFGAVDVSTPATVKTNWEDIKAAEKAESGRRPVSALDDVPTALPALVRAEKLQKRAARVGFDWPDAADVLDKIEEEIGELRKEMAASESAGSANAGPDRVAGIGEEIGDLLFALVNLARRLDVDAETALRAANAKFTRRFRFIERSLADRDRNPKDATLDEMDALWGEAKARERAGWLESRRQSAKDKKYL